MPPLLLAGHGSDGRIKGPLLKAFPRLGRRVFKKGVCVRGNFRYHEGCADRSVRLWKSRFLVRLSKGAPMEEKSMLESQLRQELQQMSQRVAALEASATEQKRVEEILRLNEELKREIAERERAKDILRNSEALYSSLVENLPVHVLRKDTDGRFVFANRSFCELLDRPFEEIVGRTDFDLFPEVLAEKLRQDYCTVMETGQLFETIEESKEKRGRRWRYMEVMKSPVRDAAGKSSPCRWYSGM